MKKLLRILLAEVIVVAVLAVALVVQEEQKELVQ